MTAIILLFSLGLALILLEVIVPGGILGTIGGLMLFAGCIVSFVVLGTGGGLIATASALASGGLLLWFEFRILPKTKLGRRAFLNQEITGVSAAYGKEAQALVGKAAEALTTLSPSGYISIDGQRYEAFCNNGYTTAGTALKVVGVDNFRLIVTHSQTNSTP